MLFELKIASRTLRSRPLFTAMAVATLAVGIGANAAMFAVVDAVLLRPLPYPAAERLVSVYSRYLPATGYDFPYFALSGPEFIDIRNGVAAFAAVAAYDFRFRNLTADVGEAERVLTMAATAEFFDVLGIRPVQGRTFTEREAQDRERCVLLVEHGAARRIGVEVGSTLRLDHAPCEVVGVMPEGFGFSDNRVQLWTTLAIDTEETPTNRASHPLLAIARLREGAAASVADAQLQSLRWDWSEQYPDHYAKGHFAVLRPLQEDLVGDQRQALLLLAGAVLCVLLIVCVNVAGLLVSRSEERRRDFAVRQALGADRRRLAQLLLGEAMLLAAAGGLAGVLLSQWLLAALLAFYHQRLPVWQTIAVDRGSLAFASTLVLIAGCILGLVPALHTTRIRLQESLNADARTSTATRQGVAARSVLVIGQLAMSIVLLVGAVLLIRSYRHLQEVDLGLDAARVLTFSVSVPEGRQPDSAAARRTLAAIEARLAAVPGVDALGAISSLPVISAGPPDDFVIEGRSAPAPGNPAWNARYVMATPGVFRAFRIPLKRGRLIAEKDAAGQPLVAVINETAARLYWPNEDPVGRAIRYYPRETSPSIRIVGLVGDVRSLGPDAPAPPAVYVPFEQAPRPAYEGRSMTFLVRATGHPTDLVPSVRRAVASIDPGLPLADVRPMTEVVSQAAGQPRFTAVVMSFFAGVAFFLAALGLYGTQAYAVEQRRREIGVRIALGADRAEIFRLIMGKGMALALGGLSLGVAASFGLSRLLSRQLSGVTSTDGLTYAVVIAMLIVAALLASFLPARRAARVDPIVALHAP